MSRGNSYLLDTNIISELVRNPQGVVTERLKKVGDSNVLTSIVVVSELRFGVKKKASDRLRIQLEKILSVLEIMPLEEPVDECYAKLRLYLEMNGQPIGPNDMFIAAHALALDATLVTANVSEFSRIPEIRIENWLE